MAQEKATLLRRRAGFMILATAGVLCVTAALLVGISDNPPGILLCYGGVTSLILAFVHRWREPRRFFLLLGWSFLGFVAGAIVHNLLGALGHGFPNLPAWFLGLLEVANVAAFLVAVLACPPGILVGLLGYLVVGIWQRTSRKQPG